MLLPANIFQPLIDVFESVLKFFHNSVGVSWGWSIVLLTVVIRALLVPLTVKQFSSMQKLQQLQPQLKEIQTKYKDDKQRQQQEMMKFYKENQVNPLGSCLPLVAQLPVFISLFYMLRQSLRTDICPSVQLAAHTIHHVALGSTVPCTAYGPFPKASFLFIPDLTNKATGAVLVVMIILYVGTQLASSLLMSSPTMDPTQRRIMLLLPLFFVIFIINFPAGVIVYWITTNTWTIGQQYVIKRRLGHMTPVPAAAGAAAGGRPGATPAGAGAAAAVAPDGANGASSGGLSALLRGRSKSSEETASVGAGSGRQPRGTPPPPPPRKKKKRSGRRR
jgi:YidC/Oxa1 family membrane protein insertase